MQDTPWQPGGAALTHPGMGTATLDFCVHTTSSPDSCQGLGALETSLPLSHGSSSDGPLRARHSVTMGTNPLRLESQSPLLERPFALGSDTCERQQVLSKRGSGLTSVAVARTSLGAFTCGLGPSCSGIPKIRV